MTGGPTTEGADAVGSPAGRIRSVDRAVALLLAVSEAAPAGRTLAELADGCGLNRSTAWRLLSTLEASGMVDRDRATNRYRVGFTAARLAGGADHEGLVRRGRPVLSRLSAELGQTLALAVPRRTGVLYVDQVSPSTVITVNWVGREAPWHATSAGRALLAWLPDDEQEEVVRGPLQRFTDRTLTDPVELRAELSRTRAKGYAACSEELEPGLCGVAAPIRVPAAARPVAVLSIWGIWQPATRDRRFVELGPAVRAGAEALAMAVDPSPGAGGP